MLIGDCIEFRAGHDILFKQPDLAGKDGQALTTSASKHSLSSGTIVELANYPSTWITVSIESRLLKVRPSQIELAGSSLGDSAAADPNTPEVRKKRPYVRKHKKEKMSDPDSPPMRPKVHDEPLSPMPSMFHSAVSTGPLMAAAIHNAKRAATTARHGLHVAPETISTSLSGT
jgi:hypothetical protein